jgi:SAM-dependent methyltransferase
LIFKNKEFSGSGISIRSPIKITSELLWVKLQELAKQYASGRLIDIGCGVKPYAQIFAPYVTTHFGVDWEGVSDTHYGSATKADLYADCTDTGLESGGFDTLLSTQVMEHIYETHVFIKECHRLLKIGGVGIFTVPFVWEVHAEPFDYYRFTRHSLEKIFEEHGFVVEKIEPVGGVYATIIQMKIVSLYYRPVDNKLYRMFRRMRNELLIPLQNYMALRLDRFFWSDKLCLNYTVVVRKKSE